MTTQNVSKEDIYNLMQGFEKIFVSIFILIGFVLVFKLSEFWVYGYISICTLGVSYLTYRIRKNKK